MDICDKKNQIMDLLNDIFSEYNRMNESKIQSKCENDLEMRNMISNIRSLENSSLEKDNRIKTLEKTLCDYDKIIEDLNSKLEIKEECDRENNRHDMLRALSKDISEKDREIKRLNDLLEFHKKNKEKPKREDKQTEDSQTEKQTEKQIEDKQVEETNTEKNSESNTEKNSESNIDDIIDSVSNKEDKNNVLKLEEVVEIVNKETCEINPNFIYKNDILIPQLEQEPSNPPSPVENILNIAVEPESPKKTLMKIKAKNIFYFVYKEDDPDQDVYEYNEEKRTDKIVGKRIRVNGKSRLDLF